MLACLDHVARVIVNVAQRRLGGEFPRDPLRRLLARLFWREGGDDLLEARIAAERVPKGEQLKHAVARG